MSITKLKSVKARAFFVISIFVIFLSPAYGEMTIGRWCDRPLPSMPELNNIKAIIATDDGKVVLKSNYADGSSSMDKLHEAAGGIYEKIGNGTGDKYRIVPNDGSLQLLDNDGLIRVASRLENTPRKGECFK